MLFLGSPRTFVRGFFVFRYDPRGDLDPNSNGKDSYDITV